MNEISENNLKFPIHLTGAVCKSCAGKITFRFNAEKGEEIYQKPKMSWFSLLLKASTEEQNDECHTMVVKLHTATPCNFINCVTSHQLRIIAKIGIPSDIYQQDWKSRLPQEKV